MHSVLFGSGISALKETGPLIPQMPSFNFVFLRRVIRQSHFFQLQAEDRVSSLHVNISFAFSVLLNFLLLKYQGKENSPFETNPKMIYFGVATLILYASSFHCLRRISQHRLPRRSFGHVIYRCMLLFGYLSVAALASLLYSGLAAMALFVVGIMLSVGDLLYSIYRRIRAELREAHLREARVQLFFNRLTRRRFVNYRQILPV